MPRRDLNPIAEKSLLPSAFFNLPSGKVNEYKGVRGLLQ
jgi:hypothetical protein